MVAAMVAETMYCGEAVLLTLTVVLTPRTVAQKLGWFSNSSHVCPLAPREERPTRTKAEKTKAKTGLAPRREQKKNEDDEGDDSLRPATRRAIEHQRSRSSKVVLAVYPPQPGVIIAWVASGGWVG